jgi:hypothetical protein
MKVTQGPEMMGFLGNLGKKICAKIIMRNSAGAFGKWDSGSVIRRRSP